jgi:hypothetical protein
VLVSQLDDHLQGLDVCSKLRDEILVPLSTNPQLVYVVNIVDKEAISPGIQVHQVQYSSASLQQPQPGLEKKVLSTLRVKAYAGVPGISITCAHQKVGSR